MIARPPCDEGVIQSTSRAIAKGPGAGFWVLLATILGSSMVFIDGSVVNVILPVVQADLRATSVDLQWIVVGYTLFLSSLMLVGGSLGDHYGRRRIFVAGIVVFALASAWCGFASSALQLVLARAVQGVGSAMLTPGSLSIIGASFAETERGKAIGTWSSFTAITAALGPALGGWLTDHVSWRAVFFINIPLAIAVIAISLWRVPESSDEEKVHHVDWLGAALCTLGLGGIVYGLTFASILGWGASSVLAGIAVGAVAIVSFIIVEARSPAPLMPLSLFSSRTFSGVNALTLLLYAALACVLFYLPFALIQVHGYTPTAAGFAFLPFIALIFLFSRFSGSLVPRFGARPPLIIGPLVAAIGCALFALPGTGGTYWTTFFPALFVLGVGMAITVAPLTAAVMGSVDPGRVGVASGVNNAISRVAGMLAVAACGIAMVALFSRGLERGMDAIDPPAAVYSAVMNGRFALAATSPPAGTNAALRLRIHDAVLDAYVDAFRTIMLSSAALAAAGALVAALTIDRRR